MSSGCMLRRERPPASPGPHGPRGWLRYGDTVEIRPVDEGLVRPVRTGVAHETWERWLLLEMVLR